jgi:hypothetical protein
MLYGESMIRNAFVKVNPSDNGDLFYKVLGFDTDLAVQREVIHCTAYPFMWGFRDVKHALAIADACNTDAPIGTLMRRFTDEEYNAHALACEKRWRAHDAQDMEAE